MSKHTPGPWVAKMSTFGTLKYWVIEEKQYNGFQIASTVNSEIQRDEANAHLIAAAPEMLEALKAGLIDHPNSKWQSYKQIENALLKAGVRIPKEGEPFDE